MSGRLLDAPLNGADRTRGNACGHVKLALAILGSVGFVFPLIEMLRVRASPLIIANESLAYRFLLSERILHGEGSTAWIWQGFLTSALQTSILSIINVFTPTAPEQLESRIRWFSLIYLAVVAAGCTITLLVCARLRTIDVGGMLLLVLAAVGPVFVIRVIGFYYYITPDYLVLDVLLALVALALFEHWWSEETPERTNIQEAIAAAGAGLVLGITTANKITMMVLGTLPVVALLCRARLRWKVVAAKVVLIIVAAMVGYGGVLLWMYRGDAGAAVAVLKLLAATLGTLSRPEAGFWAAAFRASLSDYAYGIIVCFYPIAVVVAAIPIRSLVRSRSKHYLALSALILGGATWIYFLAKRPAGTTFFEGVMAWLVMGCMALSMMRRSRGGLMLIGVASMAATVYGAVTFSRVYGDLGASLRGSRSQGAALWQLQRELLSFATGHEVIVLIPDNSYCYGGVPELLLKGTADFPTWNVTSHGRPTLERYAPRFSFRSNYTEDINSAYPPNAVLFWVDLPEKPPIAAQCVFLRGLTGRTDLRRKSWLIPAGATRTLKAYAIETLGTRVGNAGNAR